MEDRPAPRKFSRTCFVALASRAGHRPPTGMTRSEAIAKSLTALIDDDVERAVAISSNFHGGAGSLYESETVNIVRFILDHEYTPDPTIKPKVLAPLRVAAAAMELWGEFRLEDFADVSGNWKYKHTPELVTGLLYAAGLEQHRLQRLNMMGATRVQIRSGRSSGHCPACSRDLGTTVPIADAPFLPHPDCSCDSPCQCSYIAVPAAEAEAANDEIPKDPSSKE
jgi:hypothetical protein